MLKIVVITALFAIGVSLLNRGMSGVFETS